MANQLLYKSVQVGSEIPTLVKHTTTRQLVVWAGASEEYYEIHYDKDFAISQGLPGVLAAAGMVWSFLGQMLTDWIGEQGTVRKLSSRFLGMHFPNEDIICKGIVLKKYVQDGEHYVECKVWVENVQGAKTVSGVAVVVLPD